MSDEGKFFDKVKAFLLGNPEHTAGDSEVTAPQPPEPTATPDPS